MAEDPIHFGTDGWRAIIGREFTFANVRRVAQAAAGYFKGSGLSGRPVLVGYDNRFLSETFAAAVAEVLAGNGLRVWLADSPLPTPALSWGVKRHRAAGAVIITSSHNPYAYNGFKLKESFGGSARVETTRAVEKQIDRAPVRRIPLSEALQRKTIERKELAKAYLEKITSYVDVEAIRANPVRVVYDPIFGSGIGFLERALLGKEGAGARIQIQNIHGYRDPRFGGLQPEPIPEVLADLGKAVKAAGAQAGLAVDGDADRIGVVDERGQYVTSHKILALLIHHFVENRGERGPVGKTISGTFLVDRMCRAYHLPLRETPVGFKYLGELLLNDQYMLAGEESGGMGFQNYLPERDGVLSGLLLLEMMAMEKKSLSAILADITREFGVFQYDRVDQPFPLDRRERLLAGLVKKAPGRLDRVAVGEIKDYDGVKYILKDGSWLLIRPSGTEPLVRIYSEAPTKTRVAALLAEGKKLVAQYEK